MIQEMNGPDLNVVFRHYLCRRNGNYDQLRMGRSFVI